MPPVFIRLPARIKKGMASKGKAVVRAIEGISEIDLTGPIERAIAGLLLSAYKRRLRAIVEVAPDWMSEEILSALEHIGARQAVVWVSKN